MNDYEVTVSLSMTYVVTAPNEAAAAEMALEWFDEADRDVEVTKIDSTTSDE